MLGKTRRGQSIVEFALILPILLLIVLGIAEAALVVQGHLAVQHAAREAARFAVTYQPPQGACLDLDEDGYLEDGMSQADSDDLAPWPYCPTDYAADINEADRRYYERRIALIRRRAFEAAAGLRINSDHLGDSWEDFELYEEEPGFFGVLVWGFPSFLVDCNDPSLQDKPWDPNDDPPGCLEHPGLEGLPVRVAVKHNVELVDPLYRLILQRVTVRAESQMINEGIQVGFGDIPPPHFDTNPDLNEPTVVPTEIVEPTATATMEPVSGYSVVLDPGSAVNILPDEPSHEFVATVKNQDSLPVQGAVIGFSIGSGDVGGFNASGTAKYAERTTNAQGEASVTIYGYEAGTATIRAWIDADGDDQWAGDSSEPSDTATKTWSTESAPYIQVSDYDVFAKDLVDVYVLDHDPNTSYRLVWCVISGTTTSKVMGITTGSMGDTTVPDYEIPENSSGLYQLETHPDGGGGCGAADLVARSTAIRVKVARPDLSITLVEPTDVCPETDFTVSAIVENHTPGGTDQTFDVDFFVAPEGGILPKQWIDGIGPNESVTVNAVGWVATYGMHGIVARVDASDYVEEEDEHPNEGQVYFFTADEAECGDGDDPPPWGEGPCKPPGSRECEQLLEKGGFEGNPGSVFAYWRAGGTNAYQRQSLYFYEGTASMRLHASLGSFPDCPALSPYLYQMATIPDLTGGCTDTMETTLIVRGQRLIAESQAPCSIPDSVDADDELYVQLRSPQGNFSRLVTRGAPQAAAPSPTGYANAYATGAPAYSVIPELPDGSLQGRGHGHQNRPGGEARASARASVRASRQDEMGSRKAELSLAHLSSTPGVALQSGVCPIDDDFNDGAFDSQWTLTAVGNSDGSVDESGGQLTINARGDSTWGTSDNLYYVHQSFSGQEFDAKLRILYGPDRAKYAKMGLMVRNSTAANSRYVMLSLTDYGGRLQFAYRPTDGGDAARLAGTDDDIPVSLPVWVRIVRSGNAFEYYYSEATNPGEGDWTFQGSIDVPMNNTVQVGIAHASYSSVSYDDGAADDISVCLPVSVDFSSASYSVGEGAGSAQISVRLSTPVNDTVTVDYATSDGTATAGEDYTATGGTLTFDPNDTEETFSVDIISDSVHDGEETVILTLSNPTLVSIGPNNPATLSIIDDEAPPEVNFSSPTYSASESGGTATITATMDVVADQVVVVGYEVSDGTASAGADYTGGGGNLIFPEGETVATFQIPLIDDLLIEGDETVNLALLSSQDWIEDFGLSDGTTSDTGRTAWSVDTSQCGEGAVFEVQGSRFTASDTDGTGTSSGGAVAVWESDVIEISGSGSVDIAVDIWSEGSADASDYVRVAYKLDGGSEVVIAEEYDDFSRKTVGASDLSGSTVQIIIRADLNYDDESYHWDDVTVDFDSGEANVGPNGSATLTIVDDDTPVQIDFSSSAYTVTEDVGLALLTVMLNEEADWTVVAQYSSSDITARAGEDYSTVSGTLVFDPGETEKTFTVPIIDDSIYEDSETLRLTLQSNPVSWVEAFNLSDGTTWDTGETAWSVDTSQCNDWAEFEVQSGAFKVSDTDGEGIWTSEAIDIAGAGDVEVSLDMWSEGSADSDDYIRVYYKLDGGPEVLFGENYDDFSSQTVSASGLSGDTIQVIVRANLNYYDESYHWDNVTVTNGGGPAGVGPNSPATLTIIENESQPTVGFSSANYSVAEDAGPATITVTLSGASYETIAVDYATSDGTATAGDDYESTTGTLTFSPGTLVQVFKVPIIDDDEFFEGDETVELALYNAVGTTIDPERSSATLTIEDDDVPTVDFLAPHYVVDEGAGQAVITVALNLAYTATVTVDYGTVEDSAIADEDYTPVSGTLTFDPGVETLTFEVPVIDDAAFEDDEMLNLVLSNAQGARVGRNNPATLVILDDEPIAPETWKSFSVDFSGDLDVASLIEEDVQIRFYATHDGDPYGTWFYLDAVECEVCNEWPIPTHESGQGTIEGMVRREGERQGGVDVWAYSHDTDTTYHTVSLDGGEDLFPRGAYHFYNIPPGSYTVYSECWVESILFWDTKEVTVGADDVQRVDLNLQW